MCHKCLQMSADRRFLALPSPSVLAAKKPRPAWMGGDKWIHPNEVSSSTRVNEMFDPSGNGKEKAMQEINEFKRKVENEIEELYASVGRRNQFAIDEKEAMRMAEGTVQRSDSWKRDRLFRITATRVSAFIGINKWTGVDECISTCVYGEAGEKWRSEADKKTSRENMDRGVTLEPEARQYYLSTIEKEEGVGAVKCEEKGVIVWNKTPFSFSPDGIVTFQNGTVRLIEIKCPRFQNPSAPVEIPMYYYAQMQQAMFISGIHLCDYIVYVKTRNPERPPILRVVTVPFDTFFCTSQLIPDAVKVWSERVFPLIILHSFVLSPRISPPPEEIFYKRLYELYNPKDEHAIRLAALYEHWLKACLAQNAPYNQDITIQPPEATKSTAMPAVFNKLSRSSSSTSSWPTSKRPASNGGVLERSRDMGGVDDDEDPNGSTSRTADVEGVGTGDPRVPSALAAAGKGRQSVAEPDRRRDASVAPSLGFGSGRSVGNRSHDQALSSGAAAAPTLPKPVQAPRTSIDARWDALLASISEAGSRRGPARGIPDDS